MSYLFHGQRASEEVILICKPHPFILLKPFLVSALILLIALGAYFILLTGPVLSLIIVICALLAVSRSMRAWYAWNNTVLLLTNERVVFLQQKHFFDRHFAECGLGSIHHVSHDVKGLLNTMLGFGTIKIQTIGGAEPLQIANIPDPYDIQQEILRASVGEEAFKDENAAEPEDDSGEDNMIRPY